MSQGMVDTSNGVFFSSMLGPGFKARVTQDKTSKDFRCRDTCISTQNVTSFHSLVEPSDRIFATEYAFFVMAQMTTTTFTEADRLGKRKG